MTMVALWFIMLGSAPTKIGLFTGADTCFAVAGMVAQQMAAQKPRAFLYRLACVPTIEPMMHPLARPEAPAHPSAES